MFGAVFPEKSNVAIAKLGQIGRGAGPLLIGGIFGVFYSPAKPGPFNPANLLGVLAGWFEDDDGLYLHSGLKMRSPRKCIAAQIANARLSRQNRAGSCASLRPQLNLRGSRT